MAIDARQRSVIGGQCRVADPDDDVAARSAALLPRFPPGPAASHVLIDVPPRRVPVRASANLALAHSPQPDPRIDQQLHDLLDVPAEPVVITAGIALAYHLGGHLPDQAPSILIDASHPGIARRRWPDGIALCAAS